MRNTKPNYFNNLFTCTCLASYNVSILMSNYCYYLEKSFIKLAPNINKKNRKTKTTNSFSNLRMTLIIVVTFRHSVQIFLSSNPIFCCCFICHTKRYIMFSVQIKLKFVWDTLLDDTVLLIKILLLYHSNGTTKPVSERVNGSYNLLCTSRPDITFLNNPS